MKRALITSGGGAKGAFTVGALQYMAEKGIKNFDVISGTSTGSLIAAMAVINELDPLLNLYSTVNNDQILQMHNIVDNLMNNHPYLFDTFPLQNIINSYLTPDRVNRILTSDTALCLTSVSLNKGDMMIFHTGNVPAQEEYYRLQKITNKQELTDALTASSSQAGFLDPAEINTAPPGAPPVIEQFVDGGHMQVVPTRVITNYDLDEIYILSNNPMNIFEGKKKYISVLDVLMRAIGIFVQDVRNNDFHILDDYAAQHPNTKIFKIYPPRDLDTAHPTGLSFVPEVMQNWITIGRSTAKQILQLEPDVVAGP